MQDLDETHLLVNASVEKFLAAKLEEYVLMVVLLNALSITRRWYDQVHYTVPMYSAAGKK